MLIFGPVMNVLFVCTANVDRSRTAHHIFEKEKPEHSYKSCGTSNRWTTQEGTTLITAELCEWAELIVCMEEKHEQHITEAFGPVFTKKVRTIDLEDYEIYMSDTLISILREKIDFL